MATPSTLESPKPQALSPNSTHLLSRLDRLRNTSSPATPPSPNLPSNLVPPAQKPAVTTQTLNSQPKPVPANLPSTIRPPQPAQPEQVRPLPRFSPEQASGVSPTPKSKTQAERRPPAPVTPPNQNLTPSLNLKPTPPKKKKSFNPFKIIKSGKIGVQNVYQLQLALDEKRRA